MRTFVKTLAASTMAVFVFTAAQAADAIDQIPEAPVAVDNVVPAGNWAGAYAGVQGNYNFGRFRGQDDFDAKGFGGAAYGGYNMQDGQIVYGAEADLGYSGVDSTASGIRSKQGVNGSVRARVGYDLNPVLLYGTAGIAGQSSKASDATSSDRKTAVGYTVGAGVETFLTQNITARAEYRYTDFKHKDFDLDSGKVSRGFDEQSVNVGIGMKF